MGNLLGYFLMEGGDLIQSDEHYVQRVWKLKKKW